MKNNSNCPLYETKYCDMLSIEACSDCLLNKAEGEEAEKLIQTLKTTDSLMPEEGIEDLFLSESCVLCKGEERGERRYYAVCDIGNAEPRTEGKNLWGGKSVLRSGSLVPVQLSCCEACRKRLLRMEYLPTILPTAFGVLSLSLLSVHRIRESIVRVAPILPVLIFGASLGIGFLLAYLFRKKCGAEYGKKTHMNLFDLPRFRNMPEKGWFEVNANKHGVSHFIFTKEPLKHGLYTRPREK